VSQPEAGGGVPGAGEPATGAIDDAGVGDLPDGARDAAARCVTAGGDRASEAK